MPQRGERNQGSMRCGVRREVLCSTWRSHARLRAAVCGSRPELGFSSLACAGGYVGHGNSKWWLAPVAVVACCFCSQHSASSCCLPHISSCMLHMLGLLLLGCMLCLQTRVVKLPVCCSGSQGNSASQKSTGA